MEELFPMIAALAGSLASFLTVIGIQSFGVKKKKTIIVQDQDGRQEEVIVPAAASENDVRSLVIESVNFEKHIGDLLAQEITKYGIHLKLETPRKGPDFVISGHGKRIGIEVKTRLNDPTRFLSLYFDKSAGPGVRNQLERVFLVLKEKPKDRDILKVQDFVDRGKLSIIQSADDGEVVRRLNAAIGEI